MQAIPEVIGGVCDGDVSVVTRGLDVVSRSIGDIKEALKQMHGNAAGLISPYKIIPGCFIETDS